MELPKSDDDRRLLAAVLMQEEEELTAETLEGAVRALRRICLRRLLEGVQRQLLRPGLSIEDRQALLEERVRLKRVAMDPELEEKTDRAS